MRESRIIKKLKTKREKTTDKRDINRLTAKIKRLQQSERRERERDKLKEKRKRDKLKEKNRKKKVKKSVLNFLRIPNFRRKTQKRGSLLSRLSKNIPQTSRSTTRSIRTKIVSIMV
jgi:hypothetical protein